MYRHIEPRIILPQQTFSSGGPLKSAVHDMRTMTRGAIQFNYGAGLTAHIAVYASCAPAVEGGASPPVPADSTFFDLLLGLPDIAGSAGNWGVDLTAFGYPWYKARVTYVSGSGLVQIFANAKGS